jgi:YfiH family protein
VNAYEPVEGFADLGIHAFVTTRAAGTFSMHSDEPAAAVSARWSALIDYLCPFAPRLATARQVHGTAIVEHAGGWTGWLRAPEADGHFARERGTAMAVTVADCVPIFIAHPSGACALIHSGWRGTEAGILERGIERFAEAKMAARELRLHLGPAICGNCYEVSPDVFARLTGRQTSAPAVVDLRGILSAHARAAGVGTITVSDFCTRCHNESFFSHRCGDAGRQLGVLVAA